MQLRAPWAGQRTRNSLFVPLLQILKQEILSRSARFAPVLIGWSAHQLAHENRSSRLNSTAGVVMMFK